MKFAYKLQELRKGSGMSQEEFAELLGVSRQSVSKWESGKGYPEIDKLIFISQYFNTSLDLLLKDTDEPSMSISSTAKSTKASRKKKGSSIKLTKPQDIPQNSQDTQIMSDPTPNQKKDNLSLKPINVSQNAQVKPIKNHQFGYNTTKIHNSKKINPVKLAIASTLFILTAIIGFAIAINTSSYVEVEDDYIETTMVAIDDDFENSYNVSWGNLYDSSFSSNEEKAMLEDINNQSEVTLIDNNGNVYYSGEDIVNTYINAQYQMKTELDCSSLYNKYNYLLYSTSSNLQYIEVYCFEIGDWVLLPNIIIRTYSEDVFTNVYEVPEVETFTDTDIFSDVNAYLDYSTSPYETVRSLSLHKDEDVIVSQSILDICLEALNNRKQILNATEFCKEYEKLNSKCDLVNCLDRNPRTKVLVPKEFIMLNVSQISE